MKTAKQILLATILAASAATTAHADDVAGLPETQSQQDVDAAGPQTTLQKYGKANYLAWLTGPRTEGLSGNKGGTGTNLMLRNYPTIGGKFSENVSLVFTPQFTQIWDEKTSLEERHFTFDNPYFTLEDTKVLHSDLYGTNLDAYIRVYLPISRFTHDENNTGYLPPDTLAPNDNGNGEVRLYVNPTKTFLDGKLTISGAVLANYKFNRLSREERMRRQADDLALHGLDPSTARGEREDLYVFIDPVVTYSVHPKLDLYLEYASGYLHHSTDGHWTSTNHPVEGRYVSPGANWSALKNLNVNPYLSYGPVFQGLVKADIGLQVTYTFL